jgi:hypothetical protein
MGISVVSQTKYASYEVLFQLTLHTESYIFLHQASDSREAYRIMSLKMKLQHKQLLQDFSLPQIMPTDWNYEFMH